MTGDRRDLFDRWAASYDRDVTGAASFPFAGYDQALDAAADAVVRHRPRRVVELGVGTGNLAARVLCRRPDVTMVGVDHSEAMLAQLGDKLPEVGPVLADLRRPLPPLGHRADVAMAAYVWHELAEDRQLELVEEVWARLFDPVGALVIADVGFADARARAEAAHRFADRWDPDEHYLAGAEFGEALASRGFSTSTRCISPCALLVEISRP